MKIKNQKQLAAAIGAATLSEDTNYALVEVSEGTASIVGEVDALEPDPNWITADISGRGIITGENCCEFALVI